MTACPRFETLQDERILVTGSNGFIGAKVVEMFLEYGVRHIRCFVRPSSRLDRLEEILRQSPNRGKVEVISGDLLSREDCQRPPTVFPSFAISLPDSTSRLLALS